MTVRYPDISDVTVVALVIVNLPETSEVALPKQQPDNLWLRFEATPPSTIPPTKETHGCNLPSC